MTESIPNNYFSCWKPVDNLKTTKNETPLCVHDIAERC